MSSVRFGDAYCVLPNGRVIRQNSTVLGTVLRLPRIHPELAPFVKNDAVTHLEFVQARMPDGGRLLGVPFRNGFREQELPLWVYLRAVKSVGPPIDNQWKRVPLVLP